MSHESVSDFGSFLDMHAEAPAKKGIDFLLDNMPAARARLVRLCAIALQFNPRVLQVLDPSLDEAAATLRCEELMELAIFSEGEFGLTMHDSARRHLFNEWFQPEYLAEFRAASERLKNFLAGRLREVGRDDAWSAQRAYIYHLIGSDEDRGIEELASRFKQAAEQFVLDECEVLVNLALEYESILTPPNLARLRYLEARLATDQLRWKDASRILRAMLETDDLDEELRVKSLERLGLVYKANREWDKAIDLLEQALAITATDPRLQANRVRILETMGATYREQGEFNEAEKILKQCVELNKENGNRIGLATSWNALGILYRQLGDEKESIEAFKKALDSLVGTDNTYRESQIYNNLGLVYLNSRNWDESEASFRKSLKIKEALDDTFGQAKTLNNLSRISLIREKENEAIALTTKAIQLFSSLGARYGVAQARHNLGLIYKKTGDSEKALAELGRASKLYHLIRDSEHEDQVKAEIEAFTKQKEKQDKKRWPVWLKVLLWIVGIFLVLIFIGLAAE